MTPITQIDSSSMGRPKAQIDPGQVEAFAARGYSLIDIARLIGVDRNTLLNHRSDNQEIADAHNRGHMRWKDAGQPEPISVKVLIENQVYALLQQREMSRPQLRDELGFRHEEINLAIESLEEGLMVQREDDVRTSWYRANGVASPCAEKRKAAQAGITRDEFIQTLETVLAPLGNNGDNEMSQTDGNPVAASDLVVNKPENNSDYICVDCGGPRSYGSGKRCKKCFDAQVAARKAEKAVDTPVRVSARSPDPPGKFEVFDARSERKPAQEAHTLSVPESPPNSIPSKSQSAVLCGCGRPRSHLGRCAYRRAQAGGDFPAGKSDSRRGPTYKELDLAEVERVMATEETIESGARKLGMTSAQLYVRRQKDEAVDSAVERGRKTYYANLPELDLSDDDQESIAETQTISRDVFESKKEGGDVSAVASKFGISVTGEVRKIVEELPVGVQVNTPSLLTALLVNHPSLKTHPELGALKTYIAQAVLPLKGKLLELVHKGRGGQSDTLRRIAKPELPAVQEKRAEPVAYVEPKEHPQTQTPETSMVARRTTSAEVYGGVRLHEEIQVRVEEMANWPPERIAEFFEALAKIIEVPQRPMPKTVKRAWSRDFETDNTEDGTVGLTYLYLVSMLHDGMEEHEKQAVWTLVLYLKRMQAQAEATKEAK